MKVPRTKFMTFMKPMAETSEFMETLNDVMSNTHSFWLNNHSYLYEIVRYAEPTESHHFVMAPMQVYMLNVTEAGHDVIDEKGSDNLDFSTMLYRKRFAFKISLSCFIENQLTLPTYGALFINPLWVKVKEYP
jgi:hypothetical protein